MRKETGERGVGCTPPFVRGFPPYKCYVLKATAEDGAPPAHLR